MGSEPDASIGRSVPLGGGQKFYEEFGPIARSGADRATLAQVFAKYDMTLLGQPLKGD